MKYAIYKNKTEIEAFGRFETMESARSALMMSEIKGEVLLKYNIAEVGYYDELPKEFEKIADEVYRFVYKGVVYYYGSEWAAMQAHKEISRRDEHWNPSVIQLLCLANIAIDLETDKIIKNRYFEHTVELVDEFYRLWKIVQRENSDE